MVLPGAHPLSRARSSSSRVGTPDQESRVFLREPREAVERPEGDYIIDLTVSPAAVVPVEPEPSELGTQRPLLRQRVAVRTLDLLIAVPAVVVAIPIVLLLMVAVRVDSPGPALFASRRITRDGRFFNMWKLRTMVTDGPEILAAHFRKHPEAEAEFQARMKLENDPRLTGLGRFLRRWSLDELPQLFNVIRGQMSIVGPRPLLAEEAERMGPAFPAVVRVKGGLTGLWQVSGRSTLTFEQRVPLDVEYATERTLRRDLGILLKTVGQLVRGRPGAF
jgi:lipopolysaccharide/colanic/teichoic acid biosynthesis glycosyltransferase